MPKQPSKRYRAAVKAADLTKSYTLAEAVEILGKFPKAKFDETVELSIRLGVDPTQGDQMVRGTTPLPNGSGKKVRVLVFTDNAEAALKAGADHAGLQDMMAKVNEGWLDFDVAIATTEAMKQVRTLARVLGPKGLMPNPKSGTVTDDIVAGIKASRPVAWSSKWTRLPTSESASASAPSPPPRSLKTPPLSSTRSPRPSPIPSREFTSSPSLSRPR
jgi:large subunit ribosomal protein L1